MTVDLRQWLNSGAPWIWINAAAVAASLIMVVGLLLLIAWNGLGHFWPATVWEIQYQAADGGPHRLIGEIRASEQIAAERLRDAGVGNPRVHGHTNAYHIHHNVRHGRYVNRECAVCHPESQDDLPPFDMAPYLSEDGQTSPPGMNHPAQRASLLEKEGGITSSKYDIY